MNPSKKIDISKSSLVSLKAELSRKQEEVNQAKAASGSGFIHPVPRPKKETVLTKKNRGVEARDEKDAEERKEEEEAHKKSRAALEAKSKLYDKLQQASASSDVDEDTGYLVDFQKKASESGSKDVCEQSSDTEGRLDSDEYDEDVDPEDDWVDYTDCLGRTKRCLRRDLEFVKEKDTQLAKSLNLLPEVESRTPESTGPEPELMSSDMRREQLRQKWEQQEELLRDKKDIHYQDVLFDEARAHGVGYFAFSQEEGQRAAQQEALNKQRQDTQRQQQLAKEVRERREKQLQARLQAARARNRARLGLPPEQDEPTPPQEEQEENKKTAEGGQQQEKEATKPPTKPPVVRPWDVGKEGVRPFQPMSQEEWVKKKRAERPQEFAPLYEEPSSSGAGESWVIDKQPATLFFSSKKPQASSSKSQRLLQEKVVPEPVIPTKRTKIRNELSDSSSSSEEDSRGRGVEIGPPAPHMYATQARGKPKTSSSASKDEIEKSIEAGLAKLRKEHEERRKRGDDMPVDLL